MRKLFYVIPLSLVCACTSHQINTKAEGEKLMELSRQWSKMAATDSLEKTLSYWADDAVILPPGQAAVKGKDSIRAFIEASMKIPGFKISWEPISVAISKDGDLGYLLEENQISFNDSLGKPITEYNKAVTIWRKEANGSWKDVVDTWNAAPAKP